MITGDFIDDLGKICRNFLIDKFKISEEELLKKIIHYYLEKWNMETYIFFPNSGFNNPSLKNKEDKLFKVYSSKIELGTKDKIILSGSQSFVNYYPTFDIPIVDNEKILNHLFFPLTGCFYKGNPNPIFIYSNKYEVIETFAIENICYNIENSFRKTDKYFLELIVSDFINRKDKSICYNIYSLSNYNQNPVFSYEYFGINTFIKHLISEFRKAKRNDKIFEFVENYNNHIKFIFE